MPGHANAHGAYMAQTTYALSTEVAAQGVLCTDILHARHPRLGDDRPRWLLLDLAERILPDHDPRLRWAMAGSSQHAR